MSGASIGTVTGTVTLEDRMSAALDLLEHKIERLDGMFGGFGEHIAKQATSFFTAEAALDALKEVAHLAAETLREITIEGAEFADVEKNFEHLTESAGRLGSTIIQDLKAGTHDTVTEFNLMKIASQDLAAGMNLTDSQFQTLSKGAFALAQATGTDVKQALDTMNDAMLTGRTRSLAMLTGKIDLAAAEEKFAASLGTTSDRLSAEGKLEAARAAILEKVGDATNRLGEQTDGLDEKVAQLSVGYHNFLEDLGKTIATSPVIIAGMDGIQAALGEAFGPERANLIQTISHYIEQAAIDVLGLAETTVDAVGIMGSEWNAAKVVFGDIMQIIDGDVLVFKYLAEAVAEFGAILHLPGAAEEVKRIDGEIQSLMQTMVARGEQLQKDKAAEEEWAVATGKVRDKIEEIKKKMEEAAAVQKESAANNEAIAGSHEHAAEAAGKHGANEAKTGLILGQTKDEAKKYADALEEMASAGKGWQGVLDKIDGETVAAIKYYLDAGVAQDKLAAAYNLTAAQVKAIDTARKMELESLKAETEAASKLTNFYSEYYAKKAALYGTDTQKAVAAAEKDYEIRVQELVDKGVKDVEYYNQLWDLRGKDIALDEGQRLLSDTNSKASLDKKILDAKDYFDFMMAHRDQYTQKDVDAQRGEVQRLTETRRHWGQVGEAINSATGQIAILDHAWVTDADIAAQTINKTTIMVRALSGELVSLAEAQKRQQNGGSYDVTSQNFEQTLRGLITSGGWNPSGTGSNIDVNRAYQMAQQGYSFQEIVDIFNRMKTGNSGPIPPPHGPRIPGFKDGGVGDFGDGTLTMLHGHEAIIPLDKATGSLGNVELNFYVNGTAVQAAQQIKGIIMRELKTVKQFGSA